MWRAMALLAASATAGCVQDANDCSTDDVPSGLALTIDTGGQPLGPQPVDRQGDQLRRPALGHAGMPIGAEGRVQGHGQQVKVEGPFQILLRAPD